MKVYVDELPKSCKDCFFCEHIEEDVDGKGRDEVACYFEGFLNNVLLGETFNAKNCKHLQSLADYTKQVRKEAEEKWQTLKLNLERCISLEPRKNSKPITCEIQISAYKNVLECMNKLDQIQTGGIDGEINTIF